MYVYILLCMGVSLPMLEMESIIINKQSHTFLSNFGNNYTRNDANRNRLCLIQYNYFKKSDSIVCDIMVILYVNYNGVCSKMILICSSVVMVTFVPVLADEDFLNDLNGTELVFQEGDTRQCVDIQILDDLFLEMEECFFVDLVSSISRVPINTTKVLIEDDEGGMLTAG